MWLLPWLYIYVDIISVWFFQFLLIRSVMYVPDLLTIVLYIVSIAALFANVHWWNQAKSEPCMKERIVSMTTSHTLTSVVISALVLLPVGYYGTVYGTRYFRGY